MPDGGSNTDVRFGNLAALLMAGHRDGRWRYLGVTWHDDDPDRPEVYTVDTGHGERAYSEPDMRLWLAGRQVGEQAGPVTGWTGRRQATARAELTDVLPVLVNPTLMDQCRSAIRAAMHLRGYGVPEVSARAGRQRHGVQLSLRWRGGQALSMRLAGELMEACGCGWAVSATSEAGTPGVGDVPATAATAATAIDAAGDGAAPVVLLPEPPGLQRMRALTIAHLAGMVTWDSPRDPDVAYRARYMTVVAGGAGRRGGRHRLRAVDVPAWLLGVADVRDPAVAWQVATAVGQGRGGQV